MKRASLVLSAVVGFGGVSAGVAHAQAPGQPPGGAAATAPAARPTIAVFNMAAVMRDYNKAKYQVHLLNEQRIRMSGDVATLKTEYIRLQGDAKTQQVPAEQERIGKRLVEIARIVEDKERDINKNLNDSASKIISDLYDDIKRVVDKTAEMNGYHIVFAYPDAVTADEMNNPYLKELKLKPPAAQPFFVAKHVDLTGVVIDTLNKWFPALDAQGKPVDVAQLKPSQPPAGVSAPGAPQPGAGGGVPSGVPVTGVPPTGGTPPATGVPPTGRP